MFDLITINHITIENIIISNISTQIVELDDDTQIEEEESIQNIADELFDTETETDTSDNIFIKVCNTCSLDLIKKFFIEYKFVSIDCLHNQFAIFCKFNNIDIIKYFVDKFTIDITFNKFHGFYNACCHNQLVNAKYLYSLYDYISDEIINECFFKSCEYGFIDIVEWLYSLKKHDLHLHNDYLLRSAISNGKIELVKFFISVDTFDFKKHNDLIKIILSTNNIEMINIITKYSNDFVIYFQNNKVCNWIFLPDIFIDVVFNKKYENLIKKYKMIKIFGKKHFNCQICMDKCKNNIVLKCKHIFCIDSISKWIINDNNTCPICRSTINMYNSCIYL